MPFKLDKLSEAQFLALTVAATVLFVVFVQFYYPYYYNAPRPSLWHWEMIPFVAIIWVIVASMANMMREMAALQTAVDNVAARFAAHSGTPHS